MNATSLYVSTTRLILNGRLDDPTTLQDLHKLFPCLRQSLSCTVCGNLLIEPYSPGDSNCEHHVCKSCRGGRKSLRSICSWCKDYGRYLENVDLRTLLQCYKKLCLYITTMPVFKTISSSPSSNGSMESNIALVEIIKEGAGLKDNFNFSSFYHSKKASSVKSASTQTQYSKEGDKCKNSLSVDNGELTYSVISTDNGNRLTFKRTAKDAHDYSQRNGEVDKADLKINKVRKRSVYIKPPTCKCGLNAPAKGTCRGYKCPCYTDDKPCTSECNCVGCKNPRGTPPPKDDLGGQCGSIKVEAVEESIQVALA